jgi:hypothetical protein
VIQVSAGSRIFRSRSVFPKIVALAPAVSTRRAASRRRQPLFLLQIGPIFAFQAGTVPQSDARSGFQRVQLAETSASVAPGRTISSVHASATSICRRIALVLVLKLTQFSPIGVLFFLQRVGIFVTLQPEAEPIDRATLRYHSLSRIRQYVRAS